MILGIQTANDLENYCINLHHIMHVQFTWCCTHVLGRFYKKNRDFDHCTAISKYNVPKIVVKINFLLVSIK